MWDVHGTLIPAGFAGNRSHRIAEPGITFPGNKVHGYTDESIVVDTAGRLPA